MTEIRIDPATDMLGLIDIQPCFMPGGELPVADGDGVLAPIDALLRRFDHAFATQDWHPPGHVSFASSHPGRAPFDQITLAYGPQTLWPDHALQGSAGAALHPRLDQTRIEAIIRKGFRRDIDSYSAFFENDHATPTGLDGWLRARGCRRLFLAGLAEDFCVAWSAADALALGYQVCVIADATRAIAAPLPDGTTTLAAARARLEAMGVRWVSSAMLAGDG